MPVCRLSAAACGFVLAVCAVGVAGADAEIVEQYQIIIVDAFNEGSGLTEAYIWDVNDAGMAAGTSTLGSFYSGFSWDADGGKSPVPITWPGGINNAGLVVGEGTLYDVVNDTTTFIPGVSATYYLARAMDINDHDVVVGYAESNQSNSDGVNQFVLIWDELNGSRSVDLPGARELLRINNANVAVGNIRHSAGDSEAFVYFVDSEESINLDVLLTPTGPGTSQATDINEANVVAGEGWNGSAYHGFTWSEAQGFMFMPGLDGGPADRVHPLGINDEDVVVGNAHNGANQWRAFIWDSDNGMRDLNDLVDAPTDFVLDRAVEISNTGVIVGNGHYGPGGFGLPHGFVLLPPAPPVPPRDRVVGFQAARPLSTRP